MNRRKDRDEEPTPKCHCGAPVPCSRHTGSDGDTNDDTEGHWTSAGEGNRNN